MGPGWICIDARKAGIYAVLMSVQEIQAAISRLPTTELSALLAWLAEHHAHVWDEQIQHDLESGRLDAVLAEVKSSRPPQNPDPMRPELTEDDISRLERHFNRDGWNAGGDPIRAEPGGEPTGMGS